MAITIAGVGVGYLRLQFRDVYGQGARVAWPLGVATTTTQLEDICTHLAAITNGALYKGTWSIEYKVLGLAAANTGVDLPYEHVSEALELAFDGIDAANPDREVTRTLMIPTPKKASLMSDTQAPRPNFAQSDLAALIVILNSQIAYLDGTGAPQVGGLALDEASSAFISLADVIDNK